MSTVTSTVWPSCRQAPTNLHAPRRVSFSFRVRVDYAQRSSPPARALRAPPGIGARQGRGGQSAGGPGYCLPRPPRGGAATLGARPRAERAAAARGRPRGAGAGEPAQRGAHCTMLRSWQERSRKISRRQASASGPALALTESWSQ